MACRYISVRRSYERDINYLRSLNRELVLLGAEENPLYVAFRKAFPNAKVVHFRNSFVETNDVSKETVNLLAFPHEESEGFPKTGYRCVFTPRHGDSGISVEVEVETFILKMTKHAAWADTVKVSLEELEGLAGKDLPAKDATNDPMRP